MKTYLSILFVGAFATSVGQSLSYGSGMTDQSLVVRSTVLVGPGIYVVCGSYVDAPLAPEKAFVTLFAGTTPMWTKMLEPFTRFLFVRKTTNGDLIVDGEYGSSKEIFLCRFDQAGTMLWRKDLSLPSLWSETAFDAVEAVGGNIWTCGKNQSGQLLITVDGSGNPIFAKIPGTTAGTQLNKFFAESSTMLAFGKENYNGLSNRISAHRFDLTGNEIFHKAIGKPAAGSLDDFQDAFQLPGGGYVVVSSFPVGLQYRIRVIVLDANLSVVASRAYMAAGHNLLHAKISSVSGTELFLNCTIRGASLIPRTIILKTTLTNLSVFSYTVLEKGRVRCGIVEDGSNLVLVTSQDSSGISSGTPYVGGGARFTWVDKSTLLPNVSCEAQPLYVITSSVDTVESTTVNPLLWSSVGVTSVDETALVDASFSFEGCGGVALPVELLTFTVEKTSENDAFLEWSTATERDNDFFVVERSSDGWLFEEVETVPGAGNSQSVLQYEFLDKYPLTGTSYYRLKQVDYSGEVSYSDVVDFTLFDRDGPRTLYNLAGQVVWQGYGSPPDISGFCIEAQGNRVREIPLVAQ